MSATWRQENNIPKPKTTRKPAWCDSSAIVIIAPRILGSEISETYVMAGVSFNPIQNPISVKPMQISGNDWAKPKTIHVIVSGMVSISNVFRRPMRSLSGPLSNAPIGWAIYAHVANHDVCAPSIRTVSSGFNSDAKPINEGITIAEKAVNSPKLNMMKFFAVAAKICAERGDKRTETVNICLQKFATIWRRKHARVTKCMHFYRFVHIVIEIRQK